MVIAGLFAVGGVTFSPRFMRSITSFTFPFVKIVSSKVGGLLIHDSAATILGHWVASVSTCAMISARVILVSRLLITPHNFGNAGSSRDWLTELRVH